MPRPQKFFMQTKKEKHKFKDTWAKLVVYAKSYVPVIVLALLCAVGGAVFTIMGPDKIKELTNAITVVFGGGAIDMKLVTSIGLTLVAFYGSSVILSYIQGFIMASITQKLSNKMRGDISKKINKLPLKYFDNSSKGDILSRVTNDVDTIAQTLNQSVANLVAGIALFLGAIVMMFVTNWIMALVAIGSSVVGFGAMALIIAKSQKHYVKQQEYLGQINGHIEEAYSGHDVIKLYNATEKFKNKFNDLNKKLFGAGWKAQFVSGLMMPLMIFVGSFSYVCVCIVGAVLTKNGVIDFGVIVAFMIYVRLFTQPLSTFAQSATSLQQAGASSFRVFEFLEEKELEDESQKTAILTNAKGKIEFKNVHFGYDEKKPIIKDFSATILPGQKVAIVGPTGAGKTTIVNLLMRFYELDSGQILIDDTDAKELTRKNVHDLFCMVLQDTWLFEGTIKENIVFGNPNTPQEKVEEACKAVGLDHFVRTLPEGYNTMLNEEANLSSGQKQLVTIARAMISNAPMLILDEATSNVDTRTEILIQNAMDKLMQGRTSIVIAHRLSTIKNADLILVMKNGDIIESGNHEQLIEKGGFYAELYASQFEEEAEQEPDFQLDTQTQNN